MGDTGKLDSRDAPGSVQDARTRRIRTGLVAFVVLLAWAAIAFWFVPRMLRGEFGSLTWLRDRFVDPDARVTLLVVSWTAYALLISAVLAAVAVTAVVMAPRIHNTRDLLKLTFSEMPSVSSADVLLLAIPMGTLSGMLEALVYLVALNIKHIPSGDVAVPELFWAGPLMAAAGFGAIGIVLIVLHRLFGRWIPFRSFAFPLFVCLTVAGAALKTRLGLGSVAPWVLSIGVAVAATRALSAAPRLLSRFARRTAPWIAACMAVYAIGVPVTRRITERRALAALPTAAAGAPNVLVIIWDAGRALSSSLYGYERRTTPELEKLAARGATFDYAFATAPWSLPSHGSIWTGRYPHELKAGYRTALDDSFPTIGEVLSRHGYATGGFIGNSFFGMPAFGLARGFAKYEAGPRIDLTFVLKSWSLSAAVLGRRLWTTGRRSPLLQTAGQLDASLLDWVDHRGKRPFLAVVNHFDTHEPYFPPEPYRSAFNKGRGRYWLHEGFHPFSPDTLRDLRDAYEGAMLYVDHELGELLAALDRRGELANTVVIVTADHGEEFGEHNPGVVGHGITLFSPVLHVPLVIAYPPRIPGGVRRSEFVSLRDIPATIMDLAGVKEHPFPGTSLARYASGTVTPAEADAPRLAITERGARGGEGPTWTAVYGDLFSVLGSGVHYIVDAEDKEHLYDLASDPWERHDLADQETSKAVMARFRSVLDSAVKGPDGRRRARLGETEFTERGKKAKRRFGPDSTTDR